MHFLNVFADSATGKNQLNPQLCCFSLIFSAVLDSTDKKLKHCVPRTSNFAKFATKCVK